MAGKTDAYVDTSALIAFVDRSDSYHLTFRRLFAKPPALLTTTLVIAEGHAWFLRRYDRTRALQFMAMVEDMTPSRVFAVGEKEQTAATDVLRHFSGQDLTLTDAFGLHL
jgi:predicted nucleic acid-binding protein